MCVKHYPDAREVRDKNKRVREALDALTRLNIEAKRIDLSRPMPVIEIHHCPSNKALGGAAVGQCDDGATTHIRKAARLRGCRIIWSEYP